MFARSATRHHTLPHTYLTVRPTPPISLLSPSGRIRGELPTFSLSSPPFSFYRMSGRLLLRDHGAEEGRRQIRRQYFLL